MHLNSQKDQRHSEVKEMQYIIIDDHDALTRLVNWNFLLKRCAGVDRIGLLPDRFIIYQFRKMLSFLQSVDCGDLFVCFC